MKAKVYVSVSVLVILIFNLNMSKVYAQDVNFEDFINKIQPQTTYTDTTKVQHKKPIKTDLNKKRKPELFANFVRESGWLTGVKPIKDKIASHRSVNYRFSEMTNSGHWTKVELLGADLRLKGGEGLHLLFPAGEDMQNWSPTVDLSNICCIDYECKQKGDKVIRATASDIDGNIVFIANYKYTEESDKTTISVAYLQNNDAVLFKIGETPASTIRYTYNNNDELVRYELLDVNAEPIATKNCDMAYHPCNYYDKYERVDSLVFIDSIGKPCETADNFHKVSYQYDDLGNITEEYRTSICGDTLFSFVQTESYRSIFDFDGITHTDSIDSEGNVRYSIKTRNGIRLPDERGSNVRYTKYDYFDKQYPNSFKATTRYCDINEGEVQTNKVLYQITETFNYKDTTYSAQLFNSDGCYAGGFMVKGMPFTKAVEWWPREFRDVRLDCQSKYSSALLSEDGAMLYSVIDKHDANAMVVSITGERAKRLGLQDNDVIAKWNDWEYLNQNDSVTDINRLWLYTILTKQANKTLIVIRHEADSVKKVRISLPKGNLDELGFALIPARVPKYMEHCLRQFSSSMALKNKIIMAIPKNPYLHRPAVVFAGSHHPTQYYSEGRPAPQYEWYYNSDKNPVFTKAIENDKISARLTADLYYVESVSQLEKDYDFELVRISSGQEKNSAFIAYDNWYAPYAKMRKEEIGLPLLEPAVSGYTPSKIMEYAIRRGGKNGNDLWNNWKSNYNFQIKEKDAHSNKTKYKWTIWKKWDEEYFKSAQKVYCITLDNSEEKRTSIFTDLIRQLTLKGDKNEEWINLESDNDDDYYILVGFNPKTIGARDRAMVRDFKRGQHKIFIYDRERRMAAFIIK